MNKKTLHATAACIGLAMSAPVIAVADGHEDEGAWEMTDLELKLRAKNTTSVYSTPVTKEMETLLLYTVDPDVPGIAFRCEKGRLYVLLSASAMDLGKALREGVRRPRDWEFTYQINDSDPVTEDWVSMSNSRLFMARNFNTTAAIFDASRNGDGGTLKANAKGRDGATITIPESDDALFDLYIESCNLDAEYDPGATS